MSSKGRYAFHDFKPATADMAGEVLGGLAQEPKHISPKYFYDARGSELFDRITDLDEYYLTRTEMALFDRHLPQISRHLGDGLCLIEYGSGSSLKIRKLLEAITPEAYVPVDISNEHLQDNARSLHADFPELHVYPVCADFTQKIELPKEVANLTKVGFFPGSSIGNFVPGQAAKFLSNVRETVGLGGTLLIGVDRKKSVQVLESAYNDAEGVTAAFNLNVLAHLNSELAANFVLEKFEHLARYNAEQGCIQMFLRCTEDQQVTVAGEVIEIAAGEILHTENSYKYHRNEFIELAASAGFREEAHWSDEKDWFSLYLLEGC
jgi:dimethylhistidine N-methyltransferase